MRVTIRVPATVANLGPGFDILALAVQLQNEVEAWTDPTGGIAIDPGPGAAAELRNPTRNLITRALVAACAAAGAEPPGVGIRCRSDIPFGRGLGSSAAAALSGVLAANALANLGWDEQQVIAEAARIEGHPDNVAAAMLGGLVVCVSDAPVVQMAVPDELRAVLFLPDGEMSTEAARQVVPASFSREDAVHNAGRCALLVTAMLTGRLDLLGEAMRDRWHQPARGALMPHVQPLIDAALAAGAHGACLAGAGPSVLALCTGDTAAVESAMAAAAVVATVEGHAVVHAVRNFGARVDLAP
ncbi:MAG: homoserine kinase [Candidatus Dormibacteria bacterium]|jgi:homoserine kinase|nr:homoserine kinase [Chloroflexota bacterium]